jgi:hypothetical protein
LVPAIVLRYHLLFEKRVEGFGFSSIPGRIITVLPAITQSPAYFRRVSLCPPAIQHRQIESAIDEKGSGAGIFSE